MRYIYKHKKHDWEKKRRRKQALRDIAMGCSAGLMFGLILGLMLVLPA